MSVPIRFEDMEFDEGFRVDLIVEDCMVLEIKSMEQLAPVHAKQALTYCRLLDYRLGFLINFGAPLIKDGIKCIINESILSILSVQGHGNSPHQSLYHR